MVALAITMTAACSSSSDDQREGSRGDKSRAAAAETQSGATPVEEQAYGSQDGVYGESAPTTPQPPTAALNETATRFAAFGARDQFPDQARLIDEAGLQIALRDACQNAIAALYEGKTIPASAETILHGLKGDPNTADVVPLVVAAFEVYTRAGGCEEIGGLGIEIAAELQQQLETT